MKICTFILLSILSSLQVCFGDINFDPSSLQRSDFVFFGSAKIGTGGRLGTSENYPAITLTEAETSQVGGAWYVVPQDVSNGFQVDFNFAIGKKDGESEVADGLAFIINANPTLTSSTGLGTDSAAYTGISNSVALEIDTYRNTETGDPSETHTGLQGCGPNIPNNNNHGSVCAIHDAVGISSFFEYYDGSVHLMSCTYDSSAKKFTVSLDGTELYSVTLDLTTKLNLINGTKAYLGFTASTGGAVAKFNVLGMTYTNTQNVPTLAPSTTVPDVSFTANNLRQSDIVLFGNAQFSASAIHIVPAINNQRGSAWYNMPQDVTQGFRLELDFSITKRSQDPMNNVADGMIFYMNGNPALDVSTALNPGIKNTVAVEIDTYINSDNHDPLRIPHVGLQGCGPNTPNNDDHTGVCALNPAVPINIPKYDGTLHTLSLVYDNKAKQIAVYLDTKQVFKASLDLTTKLALIDGKKAYLGFIAATGGAVGAFDWLGMRYTKAVHPIEINTVINSMGCVTAQFGTSFIVSATGGIAPYTYSVNNGTRSTNNIFDVMSQGNYTVTVYDSVGVSASTTVFIGPDVSVSAMTVPFTPYGSLTGFRTSSPLAVDGVVTVYAQGGVAPYRYSLIPGSAKYAYRMNPTSTNAVFNNLAAGSYSLLATDVNGCQSRPTTVLVRAPTVPAPPTVANLSVINSDPNVFVSASWFAPANNGYADITGYIVQFGTWNGSATIWGDSITVTSPSIYSQDQITISTRRFIRVAAVNSQGASVFGNVYEYQGLCAAGLYPVNKMCTPCAAGFSTMGFLGKNVCRPCAPGTYSAAGAASCSSCTGNNFSAANAASCTNCAAGYVSVTDHSYCLPCSAGYYQATRADTVCTICPANTFSSNIAQTQCTTCAAGTYSQAGSNRCVDADGYKK